MPLSAFIAGESLKNIVDDVERIASNPGLNLDPGTKAEPIDGQLYNAPAYRWLIDLIRNLYLVHDWPFAIVTRTLNQITERCLQLPDDFWRVAYDNPLYGLIQDQTRFRILQIDRKQFFDKPDLATNRVGKPENFYISRPDDLLYLNPIPDRAYAYELHYFRLIPENTSINDVPQFPHRDYLRQALLCLYYQDQDDDRLGDAEQLKMEMWRQIRGTIYDLRENPIAEPNASLDSQYFPTVNYDD